MKISATPRLCIMQLVKNVTTRNITQKIPEHLYSVLSVKKCLNISISEMSRHTHSSVLLHLCHFSHERLHSMYLREHSMLTLERPIGKFCTGKQSLFIVIMIIIDNNCKDTNTVLEECRGFFLVW
jgi:hypothetical protein